MDIKKDGTMDIKVDEESAVSSLVDPARPGTESPSAHPERDSETSLTVWCVAAGIILVGLVLRIMLLEVSFLNFDESMHFQAAREATLADTFRAARIHTHPPLIFLFYHFWLIFGDSELMLRLPSLLFSIATLVLGFMWLKDLLGPRPALVGLSILTFSILTIQLSVEMRGYSLMLMFIFGALLYQERFLRNHSLGALAVSGCCLALAMLTHYSSAWLILVLGILTPVRAIARTLPRRAVVGWVVLQLILLGICLTLYFGHARRFMGTGLQSQMWSYSLQNSSANPETTHPVQLAMLKVVDFAGGVMGGPLGMPMAGLLLFGALVLLRKGYRESGSKSVAFERSLIVLLPFMIAMLLFSLRIYPLGQTRHSIWLIPFLAAGISAATIPLLSRPGFLRVSIVTLAISLWAFSFAYANVLRMQTTQTPAMAREVVALLKKTVPDNGLILTDDSTRNVLEYYLVGRTIIHGQPLGGGYTEYKMAGYRVITIPKFHFFRYDFRADWPNFQAALGVQATKPLWVMYFGFEAPANDPALIFRRFPPGRLIKKVSHLDNQLVNVQFRAPQKKKLMAPTNKQDTP